MIPKVHVSAVLDVSLERSWAEVREFNGLPRWHPVVSESVIERDDPPDRVGCVRKYQRRDGLVLRERLIALDDLAHQVTYSLLDPPFAVRNYLASMRLVPLGQDERSVVEWLAWFDCAPADERTLRHAIREIFSSGLSSLNRVLIA